MRMPEHKQKRGRPPEYDMPEPIPDTPENVAKAILSTPPKREDEWNYLRTHHEKKGRTES